jgi:hypothetical protein
MVERYYYVPIFIFMYSKWIQNPTRFLALTGYSIERFQHVLPFFEFQHQVYFKKYHLNGKPRKDIRKYVTYKNNPIKTIEDRLLFVLSYYKQNPIQELQATIFNITQKQCNEYIHALTIILNKAIIDADAMPATTVKELIEKIEKEESSEVDLIQDATERAIPRPKDWEEQKENYSGKKKKHTLKNGIISTMTSVILFVSASVSGATHDKKIADEYYAKAFEGLKKNVRLWQDTGYQGFAPKNVKIVQPIKKPRGAELTKEQKESNKEISTYRVRIEHAIGGAKRYRIVKDECRLRKNKFPYKIFTICAGLHNIRLKKSSFKYPEIKLT